MVFAPLTHCIRQKFKTEQHNWTRWNKASKTLYCKQNKTL